MVDGVVSTHTVLRNHRPKAEVYEKLVATGRRRADSRNVVAMWIWLESMGFQDIIVHANEGGDTLRRLLGEAENIICCLRQENHPPNLDLAVLARAAMTVSGTLRLASFSVHRDVLIGGIVSVLDGIGHLVFDEVLIRAARDADAGRPLTPGLTAALQEPFAPKADPVPEDSRSILLTFPEGQPMPPTQAIVNYFRRMWGAGAGNVEVDLREDHGRAVFTSPSLIQVFFGGEQFAEFDMDGATMWGRRWFTTTGNGTIGG